LLEVVLEIDDRDPGCGATRRVLERYVETELGAGAAGTRFAGVAAHLAMCRACRTEHDGLVALIEHDRRRTRWRQR
jgi:predicted anti-sigma-YlaC factor YlaD